jgi:chromosome partitioning protein
MATRILTIANQKGGVAKTTTAVNLSAYLTKLGKSILLIDIDPQANATSGCGIDKEKVQKSIYSVLIGRESIENIISESPTPNLFIAPSDISLVGAEVELVGADHREQRLAITISRILSRNEYDFIIIDTPPSLGLLTINALTAANSVLIPMQCEYYALEGLAQLYKTIQLVKRTTNPSLFVDGLVFCMVDMRTNLTVQVIAEVKKFLRDKVYETTIPRNIRLAEAPSHGKPIMSYDKSAKGAEAYERLAREFLARCEKAGQGLGLGAQNDSSGLMAPGSEVGAPSGRAPSPEPPLQEVTVS